MDRKAKIGTFIGIMGGLAGLAAGLLAIHLHRVPAKAGLPLTPVLDRQKPYCICITEQADAIYGDAIRIAGELHPTADKIIFDPAQLAPAFEKIKHAGYYYALVFITPGELDVNFAWRWLEQTTKLDDDPFVDLRTGFITGETPAAAAAFMARIRDTLEGRLTMPGKMIDNLGANPQAGLTDFVKMPGSFIIPVFAERMGGATISHGRQGFSKARLKSMQGAGILHTGGHGYPDRIVDSMNGVFVRRLTLAPCVIFNGACYTGVTDRWFEVAGGSLKARRVPSSQCYALGILNNMTTGYLAPLHPDHGIPVYQEMEYMAFTGASLGNIIKHTHDGVIIGNGGRLPELRPLAEGAPADRSPRDIMLKGTAARILFGDPAFIPVEKFTDEPFVVTVKPDGVDRLAVSAVLRNTKLKATYADTFHDDMSATRQFNDRALIRCMLPEGWDTLTDVKVEQVTARNRRLKHRLIGYAVEKDPDGCWLIVQVDLPSTGYLESDFRAPGATVELSLTR